MSVKKDPDQKNTDSNLTRHLLESLERAGKRRTAQRSAICEILAAHPGHPTVTDVYNEVRRTFPMISQATVYNTIDTLRELGLIARLDIANHDHTHYEIDTRPHVNVVCRYCENIADVRTDSVDVLFRHAAENSGFEIDRDGGVIVYGVCPNCSARLAATPNDAAPRRLHGAEAR